MTSTSSTFSRSIREAHRFVVAYQRRILDAIALINRRLEELDFKFGFWQPKYTANIGKSDNRNFVKKWALNYLPLSFVECRWSRSENDSDQENEPGVIYLIIDHIVDTGFEKYEESHVEPDPLKFEDVGISATILRARWITIAFDGTPFTEEQFEWEWEDCIADRFEKGVDEIWPKFKQTTPPKEITDQGVTVGSMAVGIDDLSTPEEFESKFINPLMDKLKEQIERTKPPVKK